MTQPGVTIWPGHGDLELEIRALGEWAESPAEKAFLLSLLPACRDLADATGEGVVILVQPTLTWIPCRPDWVVGIQKRMYAIEVDGFRYHGGRESFSKDRVRDRKLTASGFRVLRFTADEALNPNWGPLTKEIWRLMMAS